MKGEKRDGDGRRDEKMGVMIVVEEETKACKKEYENNEKKVD